MSTFVYIPGAVVVRARRDGPEVRLPSGRFPGFVIRESERVRGPVSWWSCCGNRQAGGGEGEQPLYFEAGAVRREVLRGRRGRRCAPFQDVDAPSTRLM